MASDFPLEEVPLEEPPPPPPRTIIKNPAKDKNFEPPPLSCSPSEQLRRECPPPPPAESHLDLKSIVNKLVALEKTLGHFNNYHEEQMGELQSSIRAQDEQYRDALGLFSEEIGTIKTLVVDKVKQQQQQQQAQVPPPPPQRPQSSQQGGQPRNVTYQKKTSTSTSTIRRVVDDPGDDDQDDYQNS